MIITVGKEEKNDFATIQDAVNWVELEKNRKDKVVTIQITSGRYEERVRIYRSNIRLIGQGNVSIVAGSYAKEKNERGQEIGTFATATVFLGGQNYELENLTIENNAGQGEFVGQAVALYAHCDKAVFRNCTLLGHQDTLCTGPLPSYQKNGTKFGGIPIKYFYPQYRQYYINCRIEGTIDFIFGGASAFFENCTLFSRKNTSGNPNFITAASTPKNQKWGYVFYRCKVETAKDQPTYLGRPWREYAKTKFWHCEISGDIVAEGWDNWGNSRNEETVEYQEVYLPNQRNQYMKRPVWIHVEEIAMGVEASEVFTTFDDWKMNRYENEDYLE